MKRPPCVAGQFYESDPAALSLQVSKCISGEYDRKDAVGIIVPHAGLMYSGTVAGEVYPRIEFPDTFILIGPNHTGLGPPVSMMSSGTWVVPVGELDIDHELAQELINTTGAGSEIITDDLSAHVREHSLEVQLPFIMHYSSDVKILPITLMSLSLEDCRLLGDAIADVIQASDKRVTILASSDMSHYEPDEKARSLDAQAIEMITAMDPGGLYRTVRDMGITMCGVVPVTTMLYAAKKLGAAEAEMVRYMTSGEVNGDYSHVVGYAGMIVR